MAISKEVTFVDATTIVEADWLNLLQEHLAGLVTLEVGIQTATQLRITAGNDDAVASIYIQGFQRYRDTNLSFDFISQPSGEYKVFVTAPAGQTYFNMEVTQGVPAVTPYRQIATAYWNGAAITSLRMLRGRNIAHAHTPLDGTGQVDHADITGLTTGDPHTQYAVPSGARPFTGKIGGVTPTLDDHIATKGYVDGITVPGLPLGTILPFASADIPEGWFVCDGTSLLTAEYPDLFAVIAYLYGGSGSNFSIPDLQSRFALGKAASGTGSTLGGSGGQAWHSHSIAAHTHTTTAHLHGTPTHTHSIPTTGNPSANHSHTQGSTGTSATHTHTGPSHTHSATSFAVGGYGYEIVGSVHGSSTTAGINGQAVYTAASNNSSHRHSNGSYTHSTWGSVCGDTAYATASHSHYPAGNSYQHAHDSGAMSGSTGSGGTGTTSSSGAHTHTNPSTSTSSNHTHSGGTSGSASPATNSGGAGTTDSAGDGATGISEAPLLKLNYIIRAV